MNDPIGVIFSECKINVCQDQDPLRLRTSAYQGLQMLVFRKILLRTTLSLEELRFSKTVVSRLFSGLFPGVFRLLGFRFLGYERRKRWNESI